MVKKSKFTGTQEEVKAVIDSARERNGFRSLEELARAVGLSKQSIYGYITRCEIPDYVYQKLILPTLPLTAKEEGKKKEVDLSGFSIDDLVKELGKRGFKVDLKSV